MRWWIFRSRPTWQCGWLPIPDLTGQQIRQLHEAEGPVSTAGAGSHLTVIVAVA
jgi:hypothetical protein